MGVAASEARATLADGDHCREMAGKLRELARQTRSPGMRRELVDLARRYDRRGDHFDATVGHFSGRGRLRMSGWQLLVATTGFGCGASRRTSAAGLSSRSPS